MAVYALHGTSPTLPTDGAVWIAPGAHVIGRVTLGADVGIWFGAVIRGDNEAIVVGAGSNIQEGVMLHTDPGFPLTIGQGCTIGHHAIVHGCMIGDNTLVGMGATVMNGAQIGSESIVGAGALVTAGKSYPARSLIVGSPARVVRTLDDAAIAGLRGSAAHYIALARQFSTDLTQLD